MAFIAFIMGILLLVAFIRAQFKRPEIPEEVAPHRHTTDEIDRMIQVEMEQQAIRAEQRKQQAEIERHEAWLRKHDEQISALEFKMNQAEGKIAFLKGQIEQLRNYGDYLELERDACIEGSSNWHKWNNKCLTNEAKVYRLSEQMDKAFEARRVALEKLEVA